MKDLMELGLFSRVSTGHLGPELRERVQLPARGRLQPRERQVRVSSRLDGL